MSPKPTKATTKKSTTLTAEEQAEIARQSSRTTRRGGHGGGNRVAEKAVNFGPSLKRLLGTLKPYRGVLSIVVVIAAIAVTMSVVGPKILGRATDVIFGGIMTRRIGERMPQARGLTTEQFIDQLRSSGRADGKLIDMLGQYPGLRIGAGIDFHRLGMIVLLALCLFTVSAILMYLQGVLLNTAVQRAMYGMRRQVSAKLDKLPLSYFDKQPRGELMSRMTNDIDNVAQTLTN